MRGVGFNTHGQWTLVLCAVSVLTLMGGVMVTRRRIETDTDLALHHTDAKLSSSMAVGLQPDKAGWHDSGVDRDCLQGCAAHGLICVEAGMNSHLHEVDTNAKLKAKVAAVGGTATAGACGSEFPNSRDVPAWSSEACYIPNGTRSAKIEDCAKVAFPLGHGKRRLCYCSNKASLHTRGCALYTPAIASTVGVTIIATSVDGKPRSGNVFRVLIRIGGSTSSIVNNSADLVAMSSTPVHDLGDGSYHASAQFPGPGVYFVHVLLDSPAETFWVTNVQRWTRGCGSAGYISGFPPGKVAEFLDDTLVEINHAPQFSVVAAAAIGSYDMDRLLRTTGWCGKANTSDFAILSSIVVVQKPALFASMADLTEKQIWWAPHCTPRPNLVGWLHSWFQHFSLALVGDSMTWQPANAIVAILLETELGFAKPKHGLPTKIRSLSSKGFKI